jgi:hypothetical protein
MKNASEGSIATTSGQAVSIGFLDSKGNKMSSSSSPKSSSKRKVAVFDLDSQNRLRKFVKYPPRKANSPNGRSRSAKSSSLDFWISRDSATAPNMPAFQYVNVTNLNTTTSNQLSVFTLTLAKVDQSVFVNIKPEDLTVSYLLAIKFGQVPAVTSSSAIYDSFAFLCSNKGN